MMAPVSKGTIHLRERHMRRLAWGAAIGGAAIIAIPLTVAFMLLTGHLP